MSLTSGLAQAARELKRNLYNDVDVREALRLFAEGVEKVSEKTQKEVQEALRPRK